MNQAELGPVTVQKARTTRAKYRVEVSPEGHNRGCFVDHVATLDEIREFVKTSGVKKGVVRIWRCDRPMNPIPDKELVIQ